MSNRSKLPFAPEWTPEFQKRLNDALEERFRVLNEYALVPYGGTSGQALLKKSDRPFELEWGDVATGGGGVSDHGALTGLGDDDHTQYLNTTRHAAIDAADHGSGAATDGQVLTADGAGGAAWEDLPSGVENDGATIRRTTNQSISNSTDTAVVFDTEDRDDNGYANIATNNTRLTIPATGWYLVTGKVRWGSNTSGGRHLWVRKNGTTILKSSKVFTAAPDDAGINVACLEYLTAADYLELFVRQGSGGALNIISTTGDEPTFAIHRIGARRGPAGPAGGFMRGAAFVSSSALTTSVAPVSLYMDRAATINRVAILGDQSGTCEIDIKKVAVASYTGGAAGTTICGTDYPGITADEQSVKTSFTGWTLTVAQGDVLNISLRSVSTFTRLTVQLFFEE